MSRLPNLLHVLDNRSNSLHIQGNTHDNLLDQNFNHDELDQLVENPYSIFHFIAISHGLVI